MPTDNEAAEPLVPTLEAVAPTPIDRRGQPLTITGRVVTSAGTGVMGARVAWMPSSRTMRNWGWGDDWYTLFERRTLQELPGAETVTGGAFRIDTWIVPPNPARHGPGAEGLLIIEHDAYLIRTRACPGLNAGHHGVGDIVVVEGVIVRGRVTGLSGEPVAHVEVSILNWDIPISGEYGHARGALKRCLTTHSPEDGSFSFRLPRKGPVTFQAAHDSYRDRRFEFDAFGPGEMLDLGDVALELAPRLRGVVRDEHGRPVVSARVFVPSRRPFADRRFVLEPAPLNEVAAAKRSGGETTDAHGRFDIGVPGDLPAHLYIEATGYEPVHRRVEDPSAEIALDLVPSACLSLTVLDKTTGERLPDVEVTAYRQTGSPFDLVSNPLEVLLGQAAVLAAGGAQTPAGFVFIRGIGSHRTHLVLGAPGHETRSYVLEGAAPGEQLTRQLTLAPPATLSGRLQDEHGRPVVNVTVEAFPPGELRAPVPRVWAKTDETGSFRFERLTVGDWRLFADAQGFVPLKSIVTTRRGHDRQDLVLTLERAASLSGIARRPDGTPYPSTFVSAFRVEDTDYSEDSPYSEQPSARTDLSGHFRFEGLRSGRYRVWLGPSAVTFIELVAGEEGFVELMSRREPMLRGLVTSPQGPIVGARIMSASVRDDGTLRCKTSFEKTNENGEFELGVYPSMRAVFAQGPQGGWSAPTFLSLDWGEEARLDFTIDGSGRIEGLLVAPLTGKPIGNARIELETPVDVWTARLRAKTTARGRFAFDHLTSGTYTLRATRGRQTLAERVISLVDGQVVELRLELSGNSAVSGKVFDRTGSATAAGSEVVAFFQGKAKGSATVEEDGTFTVTGLGPGEHRLVVFAATWDQSFDPEALGGRSDTQVEVPASGTTTCEIVIGEGQ